MTLERQVTDLATIITGFRGFRATAVPLGLLWDEATPVL